ncbi:MAG: translational GTPase TypA [Pseudomonadota bacterium]
MKDISKIRNIAIIAHVDHGKTTLVDELLKQSGSFSERDKLDERIMDSNELEKERGITILSKNTAIEWNGYHINIVDTPGHADFGGEVERVLSMVDCVLLLVDAVEGPMPQTRFVTQKAFAMGLNPIVVVNKIDREGGRPDWVIDETFDLFDRLEGTDEQMDFPFVFASAINGYASLDSEARSGDMTPLFETIVEKVSPPNVDVDGGFQMQVITLDYNTYTGVIGIGRIKRGKIKTNSQVVVIGTDGKQRKARMLKLYSFKGLERIEVEEAQAGDIIAFTGIEPLNISETICDPDTPEALPALTVDEPTVSMTFQVNNSPYAGQDGKYVTSRQIRDRLDKELLHNVALRVENTADPDKFRVSGRGELHLGILIETMRREGYELGVSRPEVITRMVDGEKQEPYEDVSIDIEDQHQGKVMEQLGERKGELKNMVPDGHGRVRLEYLVPARGLIGFQSEFMTMTSGSGLLYHNFSHYGPYLEVNLGKRNNGVLISNGQGTSVGFALFNLQERGRLFLGHGIPIYEGMIIGIHSRQNDLVVNALKAKQLTNIRAAGTDENIVLVPRIKQTLEQALEFIDEDELVEVTPHSIRLRKRILKESDRKRASRQAKE